MSDKYGVGQDPYCYPGTRVLKNRLGLKDDATLQRAESEITTKALHDIQFNASPYDFNYLKTIHRQLFGHLYDWAGAVRTVDIAKGDTRFCTCNRIEPEAVKIFRALAAKHFFTTTDNQTELAQELAVLYADLNMLHPFRDGNGRAQRLLFEHISLNCGYQIDWRGTTQHQWIDANIRGVYCDFQALQTIFMHALRVIPGQ